MARRVAPFCAARILDAGIERGDAYLVTEYVPGPTLTEAVAARGPLPQPEPGRAGDRHGDRAHGDPPDRAGPWGARPGPRGARARTGRGSTHFRHHPAVRRGDPGRGPAGLGEHRPVRRAGTARRWGRRIWRRCRGPARGRGGLPGAGPGQPPGGPGRADQAARRARSRRPACSAEGARRARRPPDAGNRPAPPARRQPGHAPASSCGPWAARCACWRSRRGRSSSSVRPHQVQPGSRAGPRGGHPPGGRHQAAHAPALGQALPPRCAGNWSGQVHQTSPVLTVSVRISLPTGSARRAPSPTRSSAARAGWPSSPSRGGKVTLDQTIVSGRGNCSRRRHHAGLQARRDRRLHVPAARTVRNPTGTLSPRRLARVGTGLPRPGGYVPRPRCRLASRPCSWPNSTGSAAMTISGLGGFPPARPAVPRPPVAMRPPRGVVPVVHAALVERVHAARRDRAQVHGAGAAPADVTRTVGQHRGDHLALDLPPRRPRTRTRSPPAPAPARPRCCSAAETGGASPACSQAPPPETAVKTSSWAAAPPPPRPPACPRPRRRC